MENTQTVNFSELPTTYDAKATEERIYKFWEDNECFKADAKSAKKHFSIVIPPPNVTGVLHMGHAIDETLQDILVRYERIRLCSKKQNGYTLTVSVVRINTPNT
jgi:valyl-tRNA synthetase